MRSVAWFLLWFAALEGIWVAAIGTRQGTELAAGLLAAGVGALYALVLRRVGLLGKRADAQHLLRALRLPALLVLDFAAITWALAAAGVRGRRVRGEWVETTYPTDAGARWQRAFAATVGTASPNAIVVELSPRHALLHAIDPRIPGGRSVL